MEYGRQLKLLEDKKAANIKMNNNNKKLKAYLARIIERKLILHQTLKKKVSTMTMMVSKLKKNLNKVIH